MFLPGKKTVCVGLIIFCATIVSLFVATFVKILNETFRMQIGLIVESLLHLLFLVAKLCYQSLTYANVESLDGIP
jgi:hypothetical protein